MFKHFFLTIVVASLATAIYSHAHPGNDAASQTMQGEEVIISQPDTTPLLKQVSKTTSSNQPAHSNKNKRSNRTYGSSGPAFNSADVETCRALCECISCLLSICIS